MQVPCENKVLEERLFQTANAVALKCATKNQWSTFHTWEYLERFDCAEHVSAVADEVWNSIAPFTHCLGLAALVMQDLRAALQSKLTLMQYAQHVQLVVATRRDPIVGQEDSHAVAVIHLKTHCVVIDPAAQPTAFKIYLGCTYTSPNLVNFLYPATCNYKYEYWVCKGERKLNEVIGTPRDAGAPEFVPMDPIHALCDTAYRVIRAFEKLGYPPSRKHIFARSLFDYEPDGIPSVRVGNRYLAQSCQLRVDFWYLEIVMGIPQQWLHQPENAELLNRSSELDAFYCKKGNLQDVAAFCCVYLGAYGFNAHVQARLELMDDIASKLGLPQGEVHRIAQLCIRVHKERMGNLRAKVAIPKSELDSQFRLRWIN